MDSWTWVGGIALAVGGLLVGGYVGMNLLGSVSDAVEGPPTLVSKELSWGSVSEENTTIQADLQIHNPNEFSVQFRRVNTTIQASGIEVGAVTSPGFKLAQNQTSPANLTVRLDNQAILDWWSIHTSQGEQSIVKLAFDLVLGSGPVDEDLSFTVKQPVRTNITGEIEKGAESDPSGCPNKQDHPHPDPGPDEDDWHPFHAPCIVDNENHWENTGPRQTVLVSNMTVYNPNRDDPIPLHNLRLRGLLHDVAVVQGHLEEKVVIPPLETRDLTIRSQSPHDALRRWWPQHVNGNCEKSPLDAEIVFKYKDREWTAPLPIEYTFSTRLICNSGVVG